MIRKITKVITAIIVFTMLAGIFTSCTGKSSDTKVTVNTETSSSGSTAPSDPLSKYTPKDGKTYEIKYLTVGYAQPKEDSDIIKKYNETFNVKLTPVYIESKQWDELLNIKFASGELPDVIFCKSLDRFSKYLSQKLLSEVPADLIEKYAPDVVKTINNNASNAWTTVTFKGKNYGIPYVLTDNIYRDPLVWRNDWLTNVGITKVPETIQEYEDAFVKFANNDPDKNNKKDTYGLSSSGFAPIFGAYGSMCYTFEKNPGRADKVFWKEKDGQLVCDAIQPETKEALSTLAKWYKMGLIDPEFITGENKGGYWAISNDFVNGRIGYTAHGIYYHWKNKGDEKGANVKEFLKINPKATFTFGGPPIGPDGKTRGIGKAPIATGMSFVFSKNLDNEPDKIGKILQMFNWSASSFENYMFNVFGVERKHYAMQEVEGYKVPVTNEVYNDGVKAAEEGLFQFFYIPDKVYAEKIDPINSKYWSDVGLDKYGVETALLAPLPSSSKYMADLEKMREQAFLKIITNEEPIDYFDAFVKNWKSSGGDQLIKEANEWYASSKK